MRNRIQLVLLTFLLAMPLAAEEPCKDGKSPIGWLGIREFSETRMELKAHRDGYVLRFRQEPQVGAVEGPARGKLRPGDVVTTMSKKTVEILNTDAEGRVVLADALHYANTKFKPDAIVDLATLTGACVVALGKWASGLFGNHAGLIEAVRAAGESSAERAWPMPLWEEHRKAVRSEVADIKNTTGRDASSSTAAAFLANFVGDTPWVHLDIAGTAWGSTPPPYLKKGATGVGVRLLMELLQGWKQKQIV